jgi:hypothetical protein
MFVTSVLCSPIDEHRIDASRVLPLMLVEFDRRFLPSMFMTSARERPSEERLTVGLLPTVRETTKMINYTCPISSRTAACPHWTDTTISERECEGGQRQRESE